jgi:hypothetical protein
MVCSAQKIAGRPAPTNTNSLIYFKEIFMCELGVVSQQARQKAAGR